MREILFRGQTRRKGEKVWMDGSPVDSNWVEGYGVCMGKGDFSVIYAGSPVEKFPVYTDTVGQFTGMTDKNGEKIFEGDILRSANIFVVNFENGAFVLLFGEDGSEYTHDHFLDEMEIIGNIHDNPELLGGADHD